MDSARLEIFEPLVGTCFGLEVMPGQELATDLVHARPLDMPPFHGRQPFSLLFRGPPAPVLPQRTYRLAHDRMPAMEIFLVPVGADATGVSYEAIFS